MAPVVRAQASSARSAARMAAPRRRLVIVLAGLGGGLLLGWGVVSLRRADSTQAEKRADGVLLAQRRAGEMPPGISLPVDPERSRSGLPASPTPLPMPGAIPNPEITTPPGPRYVIRDSAPPRPMSGHLFVDTQPEAQVWIDGEAKGKTPLDVMVGPGSKTLRLEATGFQPIRETFEAGQGAVIRRAMVPLNVPR